MTDESTEGLGGANHFLSKLGHPLSGTKETLGGPPAFPHLGNVNGPQSQCTWYRSDRPLDLPGAQHVHNL